MRRLKGRSHQKAHNIHNAPKGPCTHTNTPPLTDTGLDALPLEDPPEVPTLDSRTNLAGLDPTTSLLTALKEATDLPEVDYTHGLTT